MPDARRYTIRGRVQGVWFRDSTRQIARQLGLSGRAVNLANGDVEVLAYGEAAALAELEEWLQDGPPLARVDELLTEVVDWAQVDGFSIG